LELDVFINKIEEVVRENKEDIIESSGLSYDQNPLIPEEQKKALLDEKFESFIEQKELKERHKRSIDTIRERLPSRITADEWEAVRSEMRESPKWYMSKVNEIMEQEEHDPDEVLTLQEMCKISDATLEHFYLLALDLMKEGSHEEAYAINEMLTHYNALDVRYWTSLGASLLELGKGTEALQIFKFLISTNEEDPVLWLNFAECAIEEGDKLEGQDALEKARKLTESTESFDEEMKKNYREKINELKQKC
jgi:tetratricopeptide (TPR) repeat protein